MSTPIYDLLDDEEEVRSTSNSSKVSVYTVLLVLIGLYLIRMWMVGLDGLLSTYLVDKRHYFLLLIIATLVVILLLNYTGLVKIDR